MDGPQPLPQVQDCIMFARQQRVNAHTSFSRNFLKAPALQFVGHKDFPLFLGQFIERGIELLEQNLARIGRLWARLRRRQQILQLERIFSDFRYRSNRIAQGSVGFFLRKRSMMRFRATRNIQAPICSIGFKSRVAATSS